MPPKRNSEPAHRPQGRRKAATVPGGGTRRPLCPARPGLDSRKAGASEIASTESPGFHGITTVKTTILLVDDHPMLRQGLTRVISRKDEIEVVGEASTAAEALALVTEMGVDLVVMDLHLPDLTGIRAASQILQARPATKIIMFSSDPSRARIDEALETGACGYVLKTDAVSELSDAIAAVMAGKIYLSRSVSTGIVEDYARALRGEPASAPAGLAEPERQLLNLVATGRRNKEIADQLGLSVKSVEAQRSRLMKKLGCTSSADLVRYAIREGIAAA